ncbi:cytochrome P450 [Streptomyces shenzhenensis]|uniref:cytochrome P450 n=1 Tax=Streptomyces shenzhenensis TaxID=943815 RepID=UPI0015F0A7C2|nr:cytochrome P450 [Streptomyces shenzhenensis]
MSATDQAQETQVFPLSGSSYRCPAPQYARLRAEQPVARVRTEGGVDAWLVTTYEEAREALADPRLSRAETVKPGAPRIGGAMTSTPEMIISMDGAEHSRLRRLAAGAFTARRIEQMRPGIQRIADGMLGDLAAAGGPVDLVERFTVPLPLTVIGELLGVPMRVLRLFAQNARDFVTVDDQGEDSDSVNGLAKLNEYMVEVVAEKRENPAQDLLSDLIAARDSGDRLSEQELVTFAFTLIGAGFDTTANQLASSVLALIAHHRDQWTWLAEDRSRIPRAVEELLRHVNLFSTDSAGNPRIAVEDLELGGVRIAKGDAVVIAISSANRDERVFADPDRLDLGRSHNPHLSFGHGMHLCLGKQLTRMEMEIAIDGLVRRFPDLSLAVPESEIPWHPGGINHALGSLPVTWGS